MKQFLQAFIWKNFIYNPARRIILWELNIRNHGLEIDNSSVHCICLNCNQIKFNIILISLKFIYLGIMWSVCIWGCVGLFCCYSYASRTCIRSVIANLPCYCYMQEWIWIQPTLLTEFVLRLITLSQADRTHFWMISKLLSSIPSVIHLLKCSYLLCFKCYC